MLRRLSRRSTRSAAARQDLVPHLGLACRGVTPESYPCDIIGPFYYEDDVLTEPLSLGGGRAVIGDRPGLGVELDEGKVEKYRVRSFP